MYTFEHLVGKNIPQRNLVAFDGLGYVSWANMLKLAGMPPHSCVIFDGKPGIDVFGGVVVAVDMEMPNGQIQRTWLPVLDEENVAISASKTNGGTLALVQSALARCRAKAVAMTRGFGLCLYAGYGADAEGFVKDLGIDQKTPLFEIKPISEKKGEKGPDYLRWASALAAVKLRDPNFTWEVDFFQHETGYAPYLAAGNGYFVCVTTTFQGGVHKEVLPIMDIHSYEVMEKPTAADWNRAVMRALAKGIATQTGYGISLYAFDEPILKGGEPPLDEDLKKLEGLLTKHKRTVADLLIWLGLEGDDLSVLTKQHCDEAIRALTPKPVTKVPATAKESSDA